MTRSNFYSAYEKEVDHRFMIVSTSPGLTYACLSLHGLFVTYLKGVTFSQRENLYDKRTCEEAVLWIVIKPKAYFKCALDLHDIVYKNAKLKPIITNLHIYPLVMSCSEKKICTRIIDNLS